MEGKSVVAGLSCLAVLILLASCGSGDATAPAPGGSAVDLVVHGEPVELCIRHDLDEDGHLDVLVVRGDASGLRVLEALRGEVGGGFEDATLRWAGRTLPAELERVLLVYAARSCAVASETVLQVPMDDDSVFVSVIE